MPLTSSDLWLLIEFTHDKTRDVVHLNSVILSPKSEACKGTVVLADKGNGCHLAANILEISDEPHVLEEMANSMSTTVGKKENPDDVAGLSNRDEEHDFSASASSWEPSCDEMPSSDDEEVEKKKIKTERFGRSYTNTRRRKIIKPRHRAQAINTMISKSSKRKYSELNKKIKAAYKKLVPDSTKTNNHLQDLRQNLLVVVNVSYITHMKQHFQSLLSTVGDLKPFISTNDSSQMDIDSLPEQSNIKPEVPHDTTYQDIVEDECNISDRSEDLNRSDDNVLITNKYSTTTINNVAPAEDGHSQNDQVGEWVPIGSGTTLIHKDKYRLVNWKSYTIATRTLLLAVFPRKILATHSLTGKRSPAFQDKPAKMCLDPKIVSDVIIEITSRFQVKENLVRSIITTKCADECKMQKMREKQMQKRRTLPPKEEEESDQENKENEDVNKHNQTC